MVLLLIIALVGSGCGPRSAALPDDGLLGDFALTERNGRPVSNADLKGKVWVAGFIFTRCSGPCPQVTGTMARLQKELNLAGESDLRLVTFTVDPARDDPDELKSYAARYDAHPERWLFLTGKQEEIHELLLKQFRLAVSENPEKKPGDEFSHSTRLVLIDRRGHKRGYYEGMPLAPSEDAERAFQTNLTKLRQAVTALLRERP